MTELICIVCPKGCHLHVDEKNDFAVTGNSCPRGEAYGKTELSNPTRVLTSMIRVQNGTIACCSVKTNAGIPKASIFEAMETLKPVRVKAPVHIGDVIVKNVCDTGVDWIATKNVEIAE